MTPQFFDNLLYTNKPSSIGFPKVTLISSKKIWPAPYDPYDFPDPAILTQIAEQAALQAGTNPIVLNVEQFTPESIPRHREILIHVVTEFRRVSPNNNVGYYSMNPKRDYWRAIRHPLDPLYNQWELENDLRVEVGDYCDIHYPSIYTFYNDLPGWKLYAERNIFEARRTHGRKRVYAYMWPQFHDSNVALKGVHVSGDMWYNQLQHVKHLVDGIVLWGGWKYPWDEQAEWWLATQQFISEM